MHLSTAIETPVGFPVQAEAPVLRLMDNSGLQITVSALSSADIERIVDDTQVSITFTRYPGRTFTGIVRKPTSKVDLLSSPELHISFDTGDLPVVIGDPALVTIDFGQRDGVRWLPLEAVRRDSSTYVLVPDANGPRRVEVQIGIIADGRVEIISGLEVGDRVLLPPN